MIRGFQHEFGVIELAGPWGLTTCVVVQAPQAVVRELVEHVASLRAFDGQRELLLQARNVTVVGGPVTFLRLSVDRQSAPPTSFDGPITGAWAFSDDGAPLGVLIVWVAGGYIDGLEYGWVTDEVPTSLPYVNSVRLLHESLYKRIPARRGRPRWLFRKG